MARRHVARILSFARAARRAAGDPPPSGGRNRPRISPDGTTVALDVPPGPDAGSQGRLPRPARAA